MVQPITLQLLITMKRDTLILLLAVIGISGLIPLAAVAQGAIIIEPGARVVSQAGSYWIVSNGSAALSAESAGTTVAVSNLVITGTGSLGLTAATVLPVCGNWQNDGTFSAMAGSTVVLKGTSVQTVGGTNACAFSNLTVNNATGITLNKDITVNGTLDFQAGIVTTGSNSVAIGTAGTIANAGPSGYVGGKLAYTFTAAGSKTYPIGKGGNYRPLTLRFTALTGTSVVTAEQTETALSGTLPANTSLLTSGRYWTLTQAGGSNLQYFVTLDATGYTPGFPVVLLKKEAGTILSCPSTSPDYTNYYPLASLGDFALGMNTCVPSFVPGTHTVADLQATGAPGAVFKWYATAAGGTALAATTVLENQHHYYGSQTVNGVESLLRLDVAVNLDPTPCAPSAGSPQVLAPGSTVNSLTAAGGTGATINWYTSATGGVALPAEMPLAAGTYYASQTISCTESAGRTAVAVTLQ